jgi:hypothetical protein
MIGLPRFNVVILLRAVRMQAERVDLPETPTIRRGASNALLIKDRGGDRE